MRVCIIGGGAAGMVAALHAHDSGHEVTILEALDRLGRKICATGNGKCNLSNLSLDTEPLQCAGKYYSRCRDMAHTLDVVSSVFAAFSFKDTIDFFNSLGLEVRARDVYVYPYSEQASAVADVLRYAVEDGCINVCTECEIKSVKKKDAGFTIKTSNGYYDADRVIMACGSKAMFKSGNGFNAYEIIRELGHSIVEPLPSLTGVKCSEKFFKSLAGVRVKGSVRIDDNNTNNHGLQASNVYCGMTQDKGEIQFNDYGISGIPVMNLSSQVAIRLKKEKSVPIVIDFMSTYSDKEVESLLLKRRDIMGKRSASEYFTGLLNKKLGLLLIKLAGIDIHGSVSDISGRDISRLANLIKEFRVNAVEVNSFDAAQICSGGVDISDVNEDLSSKLHKELYFAGEVLDIQGPCGGYNLQWAWSSGAVCGRAK